MRKRKRLDINRIQVLSGLFVFLFILIGLKIFYLQIIRHHYYYQIAQKEHQGYAELPARRGEILITEYHSGEEFKLATNTTLDLIYADPSLIKDPKYVAKKLAPLLFNLEKERALQEILIKKANRKTTSEFETKIETDPETGVTREVEIEVKKPIITMQPKTDEELFNQYQHNLSTQLGEKIRTKILLIQNIDPALKAEIKSLSLDGVEIAENNDLYAYPPQINNKKYTAKKLSKLIGFEQNILERLLLGRNRYTVLRKKIPLDASEKIKEFQKDDPENFIGIRLQEEYYRYYPEGQLAAQVLGYVNSANNGQYGIEGRFQKELQGKKGFFTSAKDGAGSQITVGESIIKPAEDGESIYLTIDRAIQLEVEKALEKGLKASQADAGQAIVINPKTGAILAMAQAPSFDPNQYGEAFSKEEITISQDQIDNLYIVGKGENQKKYLYIRKDPDERIQVFEDSEDPTVYYAYKNKVGPEVYKNKIIQEIYEPGSVFKAIAMASAIDAGEVTPTTRHNCTGPIEVDEFTIRTFNNVYHGSETMTEVLQHSCNIGMAFVARKLGRNLFYNYIKKFGFGERTDIELDNEEGGKIEYYTQWAESELVTHGFGQGIAVTPLQMITAMATLANNGVLMKPYLVDKTYNSLTNKTEITQPKKIEQVIAPNSAKTITSMLINTVERGIPQALVDGHYVAGKSGTSQTYKWGRALKGLGTTIASFSGYGPIEDPQFVILVKFDHPKSSPWGAVNAAPVFADIADFIFTYYNIPPDK